MASIHQRGDGDLPLEAIGIDGDVEARNAKELQPLGHLFCHQLECKVRRLYYSHHDDDELI